MSKKKKTNISNNEFSECIITENMQNLINSLRALGYKISVYSGVQTYWDSEKGYRQYQRAVTLITLCDFSDSDGYSYELGFEWDGTPIIHYGFNDKYCKWLDE